MSAINKSSSFQPNSVYPSFGSLISSAICDANNCGMFVSGHDTNSNEFQIWKYNFSRKSWLQLQGLDQFEKCEKIRYFRTIELEPGILLFQYEAKLFIYNVNKEICEEFANIPLREINFFGTLVFCENDGKIYISFNLMQNDALALYSFDLNTKKWQKLTDLPPLFNPFDTKSVCFDNKIFFFDHEISYQFTTYSFDLTSWQLTELKTNGNGFNENDIELIDVVVFHDTAYLVVSVCSFFGNPESYEMWRFHFPSLTWSRSLARIPTPRERELCNFCITKDAQMHLCFEGEMYEINLSLEPRRLQDICWNIIVNQPRTSSLTSFSKDHLFDCGIPKKFQSKLLW